MSRNPPCFSAISLSLFLLLCGVFCLLPCAVRADPVIGPAVEQNGLRFESWLASPQIVVPVKKTNYESSRSMILLSIRVTNLTAKPIRFDPFGFYPPSVFKPNGKEIIQDPIQIAGRIRMPQEADYLLLQPGQSLVLQNTSRLYWQKGRLCLSWSPQAYPEHPDVYEGLVAGRYQVHLHYKMVDPVVQIREEFMGKIIKTLNGFWTGDVTLPPVKFELTEPTPGSH